MLSPMTGKAPGAAAAAAMGAPQARLAHAIKSLYSVLDFIMENGPNKAQSNNVKK